jgi:hypothetical protein
MADGPSCPSGWLTCADGGCAQEGPTNCGACNVTCGGNTPVCGATGCVSQCPSGQTACSGTCVDTTSNPQDCNGCGNLCDAGPPNSQPTCTNSKCGWQCGMGYTLCPDQTCDDVQSDPAHCGATCNNCMATTPPANGSDICDAGVCDFECNTGYTKCPSQQECLAPPVAAAAYVASGSGFSAGSCGTAAQPCAKLFDGISYAGSHGYADLYLAHGTYGTNESPLLVTAPLAIHGGWTFSGGAWKPDCAPVASSTVIGAPSGQPFTIQLSGNSTPTEEP